MPIQLREARFEELPAVLGVQHRAFARVASEFGLDPQLLEPIRENVTELQALHEGGTRFLVAVEQGGAIVGSVRGEELDGTVLVGRLVVDDGWTRQGIARALMEALEASYPHARRFRLFTGADARIPLALYANLGYRTCGTEKRGAFELTWLEKPGAGQ